MAKVKATARKRRVRKNVAKGVAQVENILDEQNVISLKVDVKVFYDPDVA